MIEEVGELKESYNIIYKKFGVKYEGLELFDKFLVCSIFLDVFSIKSFDKRIFLSLSFLFIQH